MSESKEDSDAVWLSEFSTKSYPRWPIFSAPPQQAPFKKKDIREDSNCVRWVWLWFQPKSFPVRSWLLEVIGCGLRIRPATRAYSRPFRFCESHSRRLTSRHADEWFGRERERFTFYLNVFYFHFHSLNPLKWFSNLERFTDTVSVCTYLYT